MIFRIGRITNRNRDKFELNAEQNFFVVIYRLDFRLILGFCMSYLFFVFLYWAIDYANESII